MLLRGVTIAAIIGLLVVQPPGPSAKDESRTAVEVSPSQLARLKARIDRFHEAWASGKWRKVIRMSSPTIRRCLAVSDLAADSAKMSRCSVGEIQLESADHVLDFECGDGTLKIDAAFTVELLCRDTDSQAYEHEGLEGWVLYGGEFYFAMFDAA